MANFLKSLTSKKAIITGGSKGIGAACAINLAKLGVDCCLIARNENQLKKTQSIIEEIGQKCWIITADFNSETDITNAAHKALKINPSWDILINNAGMGIATPILEAKMEDCLKVMSLNFNAHLLFSKTIAKTMVNQKSGKIINISSRASFYGSPNQVFYNASKAALDSLTRTMANELAKYQIQVNSICPTVVLGTDLVNNLLEENASHLEAMVKKVPLGRPCSLDDVANLATFLASEGSDFITGLSVPLDGGLSITP